MESLDPTPVSSTEPKSNRNLIIGVVVAVILCCCCLATAVGGYYAYRAYVATQAAVQQFEDLDIPTGVPFDPDQPVPGFDTGDVPQGGLADETTRYTAWLSLQIIGMMSSCEAPNAQGTTITVTQEPDGNGVWVEAWNVDCGNGTTQSYNVTFTPENGVVTPSVEFPQ